MNLIKSPLKTKKLRAVFSDNTHTDFGAMGYPDYTQPPHDKERRARYLTRHRGNESWNNPRTAGSLSRWILWGDSTSIQQNLADFKKKFAGRI
jgi:hypothetical protein